MRRLFIVLFSFAMIGCSVSVDLSADFPTPPPSPVATPIDKLQTKIDPHLEKEFAKIAAQAKGKVGVAAIVIETGDAAFLNADQNYPMQSVYKLPIAMAVMEQVQRGEFDLDEKVGVTTEDFVRKGMASALRDKNPQGGEFTIRELIRLSLVDSDGTASDVQMRIAGGADEIQSYLTRIGITDMKVVNTEKEIGRDWETQYQNWSTPTASVDLLQWLWAAYQAERGEAKDENDSSGANLTGARLLIKFMGESNTGPKRLKGMLPKDGIFVAHKTGTGGTRKGITSATNDIGLISLGEGKTAAVAVFVSDSSADEKSRELVIAKIAKAVEDRWNN